MHFSKVATLAFDHVPGRQPYAFLHIENSCIPWHISFLGVLWRKSVPKITTGSGHFFLSLTKFCTGNLMRIFQSIYHLLFAIGFILVFDDIRFSSVGSRTIIRQKKSIQISLESVSRDWVSIACTKTTTWTATLLFIFK